MFCCSRIHRWSLATIVLLVLAFCRVSVGQGSLDALYRKPAGVQTRWASFENPAALKGRGGMENKGAKGHAFDMLRAGETKTLLDVEGSGTIRRFWMTISQRDPLMLRSLRLEMYWDHADKPAVSVPLGDFFGAATGQVTTFENALFSSPEARSFTCILPMPYRTGARITISNDSSVPLAHIFYDIDFTQGEAHPDDMLYFHAHWRRERWTTLKEDFEILPRIQGGGRFLGCNVGVLLKPGNTGWWGEGEIKVYLDGDSQWPTLVGTGLEDYIGTGWGLGTYANQFQGCPVADHRAGRYSFYRYHIPDPIYFDKDCRVAIQQIGGGPNQKIMKMLETGVSFEPVTVDSGGYDKFTKLMEVENPPRLGDPDFPVGHVNVYREDDYAATAFFYLDAPTNALPALASVETRIEALEPDE